MASMTVDAKTAARKAAFARRKSAFDLQSGAVGGLLAEVLAGYRGVPLAGYMPIRTEIDPRPVMAETSAHGLVGIPVIEGEGMPLRFDLWSPDIALKDGPFGARVPRISEPMIPEIIILPLLAFSVQGGRLGYGGGFYDRTLEKLRKAGPVQAIGFAFDAQETDDLPLEPVDQPLDMIVTPTRIIDLSTKEGCGGAVREHARASQDPKS